MKINVNHIDKYTDADIKTTKRKKVKHEVKESNYPNTNKHEHEKPKSSKR